MIEIIRNKLFQLNSIFIGYNLCCEFHQQSFIICYAYLSISAVFLSYSLVIVYFLGHNKNKKVAYDYFPFCYIGFY